MHVLEQKDPEDLVFPQDVPLDGSADGKQVRYGGLTKRELFSAMFVSAVISMAGLPPTAQAAGTLTGASVSLAEALLDALKPEVN